MIYIIHIIVIFFYAINWSSAYPGEYFYSKMVKILPLRSKKYSLFRSTTLQLFKVITNKSQHFCLLFSFKSIQMTMGYKCVGTSLIGLSKVGFLVRKVIAYE